MALLPILEYPDARLKRIAAPVTTFDANLKKLVADMAETMYAAPGIGLAATQVDVHKRVIVIDVSQDKSDLKVIVNPEITAASGEILGEEGCLSVPEYYDRVTRAERVTLQAQNAEGQPYTLEADGLLAVCIQHEMDHLKGKLFVEHLSQLKQMRVKSKMNKRHREQARG
jgi:peptide deformylase